ncbi:hypothetical protein, partial [Intestinimonas butyriciproducens]|uniref:hypothetical protein n=1 Tax=Intestinimonas butyriciproducens TaxID=1297617 RepID=UPI00242C767A
RPFCKIQPYCTAFPQRYQIGAPPRVILFCLLRGSGLTAITLLFSFYYFTPKQPFSGLFAI